MKFLQEAFLWRKQLSEKIQELWWQRLLLPTTEKYIPKKKRIKLVKSDGTDRRLNDYFRSTWTRVKARGDETIFALCRKAWVSRVSPTHFSGSHLSRKTEQVARLRRKKECTISIALKCRQHIVIYLLLLIYWKLIVSSLLHNSQALECLLSMNRFSKIWERNEKEARKKREGNEKRYEKEMGKPIVRRVLLCHFIRIWAVLNFGNSITARYRNLGIIMTLNYHYRQRYWCCIAF
jgi:hypothetical protein